MPILMISLKHYLYIGSLKLYLLFL